MRPAFTRSTHYHVALLCVTLLALAARLYRLDAESLSMDELVTVETYPLDPLSLVTRAAVVGQPPLDNFLGAILFRLGLRSDWWVRFPAALFGAGSVFLLGIWGRRVAGQAAGILAALLLAACPLHLCMSQEARPYALTIFLALACGLLYVRARETNRTRNWFAYSIALWAMLMARWTDPHFIVLGIILHAIVSWHRQREAPNELTNLEPSRLWKAFLGTAAAYVAYAPFFLIVLSAQRSAIRSPSMEWTGILFGLLHQSFAAMFTGYSARTLFFALPGSMWLVLFAAATTVVGLISAFRRPGGGDAAFWWIFLPVPLVYGLVYALLGNALPKPQYLLLMAVLVMLCISIALEWLRTGRGWIRLRAGAFVCALLLLLVPMSNVSWTSLATMEKTDWRSAMSYLKAHAQTGDVAVCMGADTVVPAFRPKAYGKNRYGPDDLKFVPVSADTPVGDFSALPWQSTTNTVWMLVYTDRMYSGTDQIEAPREGSPVKSVRDFEGLLLVELGAGAPALDRLLAAVDRWYAELEGGKSFSAPAILLWRFAQARGDQALADRSLHAARRQCRRPEDLVALDAIFANPQEFPEDRVSLGDPF